MQPMIASLQMYDWPESRAANDAFWAHVRTSLRAAGIAAPDVLSRPDDLTLPWRDPALLLGQTCGYPLTLGLAGDTLVVARPVHAAEGCGPGTYRSAFVARREDALMPLAGFRGRRAAVNEWASQSGFNTFAASLAEGGADARAPFFASTLITGAHRASALAVAAGQADIAAIDCVSWAIFARAEPEAAGCLAVIGWSAEAPTLPFITAPSNAALLPALRAALADAADKAPADPAVPTGVIPATREDYAPITAMAARAAGIAFSPERMGG